MRTQNPASYMENPVTGNENPVLSNRVSSTNNKYFITNINNPVNNMDKIAIQTQLPVRGISISLDNHPNPTAGSQYLSANNAIPANTD